MFRFENPMGGLGPSESHIRFYPVGVCNIGLRKKTDPFLRSKSKNLKVTI